MSKLPPFKCFNRNCEELRRCLWTELNSFARQNREAWLVAGDFNDIAFPCEKKGGAPANLRKCNNFLDRINACELIDIGAIGSRFTWRGPLWSGYSRIFERLDRAMCNAKCRTQFPDAFVKVLARVDFSDHHPILISLQSNLGNPLSRPFRFESAWLMHDHW